MWLLTVRTSLYGARPALAIAVLGLTLIAACKDPSDSDSDGPGGPSPSGARRIAWDQDAESVSQLSSLTYYAYVDGARSVLSDARCGSTRGPAGYECSGGLPNMAPGTRVIELSAFNSATGRESLRSAPLSVTVPSAAVALGSPTDASGDGASAPAPDGAGSLRRACVRDVATCFAVDSLAVGDAPIGGVTPLPDGRVIYLEGTQRLRVWSASGISDAYASAAEGVGPTSIADIAVSSSFARTRLVYLAEVTERVGRTRLLDIVRLREVDGLLGERAVLVRGLELSGAGPAALHVGSDESLYVAMAGGEALAAGSGLILRFDERGGALGNVAMHSPVWAVGVGSPAGLAFWGNRMWVGSNDAMTMSPLSWLPTQDPKVWPASPQSARLDDTSGGTIVSVRDVASALPANSQCPLLVITEDPASLQLATMTAPDLVALTPIDLGTFRPTSVGVNSICEVFAGVAPVPGQGVARSQLLRLSTVSGSSALK
jgi:hypothetical protein